MDWLDLLAVQGTLRSLLQHHSSKASILQCSAFFIAQLSHPYPTTGKTVALTQWTFVNKVISLLFNILSRFVHKALNNSVVLLPVWFFSTTPPHCFLWSSHSGLISVWQAWLVFSCLRAFSVSFTCNSLFSEFCDFFSPSVICVMPPSQWKHSLSTLTRVSCPTSQDHFIQCYIPNANISAQNRTEIHLLNNIWINNYMNEYITS